MHPSTIGSINDGYAFQENVKQLIAGLLHGFEGAHVLWDGLPPLPRIGGTQVETDWVTWKDPVYDYSCAAVGAFLNFESSVRYLEEAPDYVADKILSLGRLIQTPSGLPGLVKTLRSNPNFHRLPALRRQPLVFLIFVSNRTEKLPSSKELVKLLRGKKGTIAGADPDINCTDTGEEGQARLVTLSGHERIHVGLIDKEKLLELAYQAVALNYAKQHDLVDERFFHEITNLAAKPLLLDAMPRNIIIEAASTPSPVVLEGKNVTYYRFSVDPVPFVRLCTVMRLVSNYDYLQRLPEGAHLQDMAVDVEAGGRFPTPILVVPAPQNSPVSDLSRIVHKGGAILSPYQWHIIDGQHRVYSYYLVKPGIRLQSLDVNCYVPANANDKATVASALFLNVNFKALKPPIDLALAHGAFASQWPSGAWVVRKRGRQAGGDSKLYSARILASRFLLELSAAPSVFKDFFKHPGTSDFGKASIQAISTYLGSDFNMRDPNDEDSPLSTRFGTVAGAAGIWTDPDPAPNALQPLWDELVTSFDDFVRDVCVGGGRSPIAGRDELQALVVENNNVFVALWHGFHWYCFEKNRGGKTTPSVPKRLTNRILPWLARQHEARRLSGPRNAYRSGSGAVRLSNAVIKRMGGP